MFTQSCFIRKNSMYIAKYLKKLGYHTYNIDDYKNAPHNWCIVTDAEINYAGIWSNEPKGEAANRRIDCGTNGRLFLAIAALRDDLDRFQWFTNKKGNFCYCFANKFSHFRLNTNDILNTMEKDSSPCFNKPFVPYADTKNWHKATVQELIEYFKDK